jgi:hypothetical protein
MVKNKKEKSELPEQQKTQMLQLKASVQSIKADIHEIARDLNITEEYALALLAQRERVAMTIQLMAIHEHLEVIAPIKETKKVDKR